MDLRTPFDDDSHTYLDGPFARFMRMRKWFFLTSLSLLLLTSGWWDYERATAALALSDLPKEVLHTGVTIVGAYFCLQALLLLVQITFSYKRMLILRLDTIRREATYSLHPWVKDRLDRIKQIDDIAAVRTGEESASLKDLQAYAELSIENVANRLKLHGVKGELTYGRKLLRLERWAAAATEVFLDFMRLAPTLVLLIYALVEHGSFASISAILDR